MRKIRWGLAALLAGTSAIACGFVACGGDSGTPTEGGAETSSQADGSGTDGTTTGNDGAGMDGTAAGDGGDGGMVVGDGAAPEGSTPNSILCGNVSCTLPTNICCLTTLNDGGVAKACTTEGQCQGTKSRCDDKTDCMNNELCCLNFNNGLVEGNCNNNCGNRPQLCVINGECANMQACTGYTCPMNQQVKTCTKPNTCN